MKRPTMLMILDGFGLNKFRFGNAIAAARTPNIDAIFAKYPWTKLIACGEAVGLPDGQMGNSEVGHMNIGSGRIVYQDLSLISKEIKDGYFFDNKTLVKAMERAKDKGRALHLFGLLSDGGVHSHIDHLFALLKMAKEKGLSEVYIHAFLDGRDVPPRCAENYIKALEERISDLGIGKIASIEGRYFAMDRDKRWERVQTAYDALTMGNNPAGEVKYLMAGSALKALTDAYARGENDEFVTPTFIEDGQPVKDGDSIIMYNFRPDRAREITRAFVDDDLKDLNRKITPKDIHYVTMTEYDASMPNVEIAYPPKKIRNTLGEYISNLGLNQLRIAETEKYAHVTFFFNGGVEDPYPGEDRILVKSPSVATYDLQPEMSAPDVTDKVIDAIHSEKYDMIILNFANSDMVGHTGVMKAAVEAVEFLDGFVEIIKDAVLAVDGQILLTADHGNSDVMVDEDGNIVTSHSLNLVPLVHISNSPGEFKELATGWGEYEDGAENAEVMEPQGRWGKLADIAPTMLYLMGLDIPEEMTGDILIK
ncbi:MAG: 2,3-bisphosphoglycerate-independent phosphoglycerate mutase [Clostridiales bacterium]|nr:2,3-bisphosphoglycerate-independent phosphoglycerate mutase [Clostridiales bacterium]